MSLRRCLGARLRGQVAYARGLWTTTYYGGTRGRHAVAGGSAVFIDFAANDSFDMLRFHLLSAEHEVIEFDCPL